ncbi:hypothetical protein D3C73_795110 [compost metagenome]
MLEAEHRAGAAETGLDFVEDQHNAVLGAARAQGLQEFLGCGEETAVALDRLDDDRGDTIGCHVGGEQLIELRQRVVAADTAVRVGISGVIDLGGEGAEILFVRLAHARQGHAEQGAAVEATAKGNHRRAVGVAPGDLHRVFHGFGAGGEQHAFVVRIATDQLVQPRRHLDVVFVGHHLEAGMGNFADLAADCLDHLRMVMAHIEDADAADEVQVALAIDIPQLGSLGPGRDNRVGSGDTARHVLVAQGKQALVFSQCRIHLDLRERRRWRVMSSA